MSQSGARERDRERAREIAIESQRARDKKKQESKRDREPEIRRSKEKQCRSVLYSFSLKALFLPSPTGEIPSCLSINGYTEKAGKCPLDPLTICVSLPLSLPNHSTSSHTECLSNYEWENIWCIHLNLIFTVWLLPRRKIPLQHLMPVLGKVNSACPGPHSERRRTEGLQHLSLKVPQRKTRYQGVFPQWHSTKRNVATT